MYELSKVIFIGLVIFMSGGIGYMLLPMRKSAKSKRLETPVFMIYKAE